jgi:hypothetical protein
MSEPPKLILRHLLDCGVLSPAGTDEVLRFFSEDAASTVAMAVVSSFRRNGSEPLLSTSFSIDWVMQAVAYCLSLPTLFAPALHDSLTIFRHWLTSPTFFVDHSVWNSYARQIFRYMTLIFDYNIDLPDLALRKSLIGVLLNDFDRLQDQFHSRFDDDSWDVLTRILIGSSDFLANDPHKSFYDDSNPTPSLLNRSLLLTYSVICNSRLSSPEIWRVFFSFTQRWSGNPYFFTSWRAHVCKLYLSILNALFAPNRDEDQLKFLGFQLHQFIHAIDFTRVCGDPVLFFLLAELVESLYRISQKFVEKETTLFKPMFPASVFFQLFGEWCFTPFASHPIGLGDIKLFRLLMEIAGTWVISPEWVPVVLSVLLKAIRSRERQHIVGVLTSGHHFLRRFNSPEIVGAFSDVFRATDLQFGLCEWRQIGIVLTEIAELSEVPPEVILRFLAESRDFKSKLDVLYILMRQNPAKFLEFALAVPDHAGAGQETYGGVKLMTAICYMVASAPAFVKFEGVIASLLRLCLSYANNKRSENEYVIAFLLMVASVARWDDSAYEKTFSNPFLGFLSGQNAPKLADIDNFSRWLHGRPINRTGLDLDLSQNLVSFMIGHQSLVTVHGPGKRGQTFKLHVRNARGLFMWELEDELQPEKCAIFPGSDLAKLPDPITIESRNIGTGNPDLQPTKCVDETYTQPSNHFEKSYILIHKLQAIDRLSDEQVLEHPLLHYKLRHKVVDFLVQTGLSACVNKIGQDVAEVINQFDAIADCYVLDVPIVHFCVDGIAKNETPLLKRFLAQLGPKNPAGNVELQLGLLTVQFVREADPTFISVVFSEHPLPLNSASEGIPKSELLCLVRPFDLRCYHISAVCKKHMFWCSIEHERIIAAENLSSAIGIAIFQFVAVHKSDLLFAKDQERMSVLEQVPCTPVSLLKLANGHCLESLQS